MSRCLSTRSSRAAGTLPPRAVVRDLGPTTKTPRTVKRRRICIYEFGDGTCFVPLPFERGRFLRTHACVAHVACPLCEAAIGEPCLGAKGQHHAETHAMRRKAYAAAKVPSL